MSSTMRIAALAAILALALGAAAWGERLVGRSGRAGGGLAAAEPAASSGRSASDIIGKMRSGQIKVVGLDKLAVGSRQLDVVRLEQGGAERTVVIPGVRGADKVWRTHPELLAALGKLQQGGYEPVLTEERYGLEWVTMVGTKGCKTLDELEGRQTNRVIMSPRQKNPGQAAGEEVPQLTALGRVVSLADGVIFDVRVPGIVIERGIELRRETFYLVTQVVNGKITPPSKLAADQLAQFKPGDLVKIEYADFGGVHFINSFSLEHPAQE